MSLLLEALKKGEQAKQRGETEPAGAPPDSPLEVSASPAAPEEPAALDFVLETPTAPDTATTSEPAEFALSAPDFPDMTLTGLEPAVIPAAPDSPAPAAEAPACESSMEFELDGIAAAAGTPPQKPAGEPEEPLTRAQPATLEDQPAPHWGPPPEACAAAEPVSPATGALMPGAASAPAAAPPQPSPPAIPFPAAGQVDTALSPDTSRQTARNVFSSKQPAAGRDRKFLLGALGVGALLAGGIGTYFYSQLAAEPTLPAPAAPPRQPLSAPRPLAQEPPSRPATLDTPDTSAPGPAPEEVAKPPTDATSGPQPVPASADRQPLPRDDGPIKITHSMQPDQVNPVLASAYQSLTSGDTARAEKGYRQVLQRNPRDRDALLGLAAVAAGRQRSDEAAGYYLQALELDPKDAAAQAGLIGLQGAADPMQSESRLKTLLVQHPDAGFLHFTLGNLYARQVR